MNPRLVVSLLFAGALAYACGPRPRSESALTALNATALHASSHKPATKHASHKHDGQVSSELTVTREGGAIRFAMHVVNLGQKSLELSFPSGQTHDVVVVDSVGREQWRWTTGRMFTQAMQNKSLDGGDTLAVVEEWEKPTAHGTLTAITTLKSSNFPIERRVAFVLP